MAASQELRGGASKETQKGVIEGARRKQKRAIDCFIHRNFEEGPKRGGGSGQNLHASLEALQKPPEKRSDAGEEAINGVVMEKRFSTEGEVRGQRRKGDLAGGGRGGEFTFRLEREGKISSKARGGCWPVFSLGKGRKAKLSRCIQTEQKGKKGTKFLSEKRKGSLIVRSEGGEGPTHRRHKRDHFFFSGGGKKGGAESGH